MVGGRKPTPTALKLVRGNPGHRPIAENEYTPAVAIPTCPKHLKGEARKEWRRVTKELARAGVCTKVDRGLLAMICTSWARYCEAEQMIETASKKTGSGLFVKSPNNYPMQAPWLAVSNKAIELYRSMCVEFGMTPSSRTRVAAGDVATSVNRTTPPSQGGWGQFKRGA